MPAKKLKSTENKVTKGIPQLMFQQDHRSEETKWDFTLLLTIHNTNHRPHK